MTFKKLCSKQCWNKSGNFKFKTK